MRSPAHELAGRLARDAEAVCRHYLSNGRRNGRYWCVGDVDNTPGGSLFVRLTGPESGKGAAGKWTDAATGEHGDLLDLIAASRNLASLADTIEEARAFLRSPRPDPPSQSPIAPVPPGSLCAARRLWAAARPIHGTLGETYLNSRSICDMRNVGALRFHPRCWYRGNPDDPRDRQCDAWPALIAAVRDNDGALTGVHRTWLALDGRAKAPVSTPRRAMGELLGRGVRFGIPDDVLVAGEGIETMLSLRRACPRLPAIAALSAGHLAAVEVPSGVHRLYLARDTDSAGSAAIDTLAARAHEIGIEPIPLVSHRNDWNDDLRALGVAAMRRAVARQLAPVDRATLLSDE